MAGSFIQSSSEVRNLDLTKDQITSYSAAILSVEIVKEDFAFTNGHNSLTLTVKADVDVADVQKRLEAIVTDKGLQNRIAEQQQQIKQLEQQVQALNTRLSVAPVSSSGELRKERNVVFTNIQELESKKLAAEKAIADKSQVVGRYIIPGMTRDEVQGIAGNPRGSYRGQFKEFSFHFTEIWNYGDMWVCFDRSGLVAAVGRDRKCGFHE
jgi:uncharacterized coiled-coil protein SlyX